MAIFGWFPMCHKTHWPTQTVVAYAFNPSSQETETEDLCEFETNLVFRVSYRLSRTTQWDAVLKKQLNQTNINK